MSHTMHIVLAILLIAVGPVCIFYLRPKMRNRVTEMKFMQTKTIADLRQIFSQMSGNGLEGSYQEYTELKGVAVSDPPAEAPFSNQKVAYCESALRAARSISRRPSTGLSRGRTFPGTGSSTTSASGISAPTRWASG